MDILQIVIIKNFETKKEYNDRLNYIPLRFPKIILIPKKVIIENIYYEIFSIYFGIIYSKNKSKGKNDKENYFSKAYKISENEKRELFNNLFKPLFINKNNSLDLYELQNLKIPFILSIVKQSKNNDLLYENVLVINEEEKKFGTIIEKELSPNENDQIIIKIIWNIEYSPFLSKINKIEKMEKTFVDIFTTNNINNITDNNKKNYNGNIDYFLKNIINKEKDNDEINLIDCIEYLGEEEILDGKDLFFCENCKNKQKSMKKIEIYNIPKILIIQLKRFNHDSKITTKVNYPINNLDLTKYVLSYKNSNINNYFEAKYDLFAVANHYGSLSFGHYKAYCKNSIDNNWYEFNDSNVKQISEDEIVNSNAYVLFYKQKGINQINWSEVYNKKYVDIDINDESKMRQFNEDYIYVNQNVTDNIYDCEIILKKNKNNDNK